MRNRKNKYVKRGKNVLEWNKIKKFRAKRERQIADNDEKIKKAEWKVK